jgi:hypothetical protein
LFSPMEMLLASGMSSAATPAAAAAVTQSAMGAAAGGGAGCCCRLPRGGCRALVRVQETNWSTTRHCTQRNGWHSLQTQCSRSRDAAKHSSHNTCRFAALLQIRHHALHVQLCYVLAAFTRMRRQVVSKVPLSLIELVNSDTCACVHGVAQHMVHLASMLLRQS